MAAVGPLSAWEQQVIQQLRWLQSRSQEWRLLIVKHQRKDGGYVTLEPTPLYRHALAPDAFVAVE